MEKLKGFILLLFLTYAFAGCGVYGFRGNNPPEGISRIYVQQFDDVSGFSDPTLPELLTQELKQRITSDNTFRIAEKSIADASLNCAVVSVIDDALVIVSGENVTRRKITVSVNADFIDLKKQKTIWKKTFTNYGEYQSSGNDFSERSNGLRIASGRITEDILIDLTSNW